MNTTVDYITELNFKKAVERLKPVIAKTPLAYSHNLSARYQCNIYLKREDMQVIRSYKIRGAYNMLSTLPAEQLHKSGSPAYLPF